MLGWFLNGLYLLLITAVSPLLIIKRIRHGKYRRGWSAKLWGQVPIREGSHPAIWFHAVSVGEVLQLVGVIDRIRTARPDVALIIGTTTESGERVARETFTERGVIVTFAPLDFTWAVRRAFRRLRPDLFVLVELELWPNLIRHAEKSSVPIVLINGRISERSFRGYRKIRPLMRPLLQSFRWSAMQNDCYADRLRQLGVPSDSVFVTGSIKWDNVIDNRENPTTDHLRSVFRLNETDRVLIAGSTQAGEEEAALQTYESLCEQFSNLRLIIVPRHPERFDAVAELVQSCGFSVLRRSTESVIDSESPDQPKDNEPVRLLDTVGDLRACWGLADIGFVGGSFGDRGGQNMIEPAGYGVAVLFGPNHWNFQQIADALLERDAARVVSNPEDLKAVVRELLVAPDLAHEMGERAKMFVATQRGAIDRTVDPLFGLLPGGNSGVEQRRRAG